MMQKENRFLDFAEQVIARHRGLGFGFEPAAMLHLEEQGQEQSEQSPVNQNFITNLYHIQNIKEENYLFKQNLSFLTQVLENKMYQKLYPSVEKQIEKVIREEMPESEAKIIRSVSEQLVRLVQQGGIRQYEILKEKVLSEYGETSNITLEKQETLLRKIENIWNSSVYHRSETKKEEHTEQKVHVANHYTTLSQNSKVTANLQFPVRELVEKHDSNAVKMLPQTIDAIKSGTESSSVETKEIVLKQLLNQITKQMNFVTTAKAAPNYESISLEYIQEAQNPELEVQHSLQVQQLLQSKVQKQVEQHTQKEIQKQIEQSASKERQPIQEATVKYTPEFYERTREQQEQIINYKESEQPKVARLESVSLEYMQEESAKETADAQMQSEVQKQVEQHTKSEVQKQVEQHTQREVQKQVEQSVQKERQPIQEATVKYTPEFYERTREQQEQIINYKESEQPKVARLESVSLEYMQEESAKETADAHKQSEVQKQVEQHKQSEVQKLAEQHKQSEVQKLVEQHTQKEIQKQVEQYIQREVQQQKEQPAQIEKKPIQETTVKYIPEFFEKKKELQEQIINYQETEKTKTAKIESVSLEYMQEESVQEKVRELESEIGRQTIEKYVSYENQFRKNLISKNIFVQNLLQGNKEASRSGKAEPLSLEYPTEETSQLHHQMVQMVQSEIQSIPQIPKIISSKDVSEQILLRMESLGLVPVTQMKTAAKTVASYQLSKVLLEHVDSEMTTEELQESMIHILQNYRTEAIKQTSVSKAFSPMVKMTKLQSKVPEFVQQMEPAPIYYRSEDQLSQEQQEKNKNLEKKVQDVVKNLKTIEEKTIVHQERIIEQQREVVHEVLKNHSKDLFLDKESTTFIRGEVQQSVEEQMSQNVGKIADKVYRQLESRLKSERGRRGLI